MKRQSIFVLGAAAALSACVTVPERQPVGVYTPPPRVAPTKVYFYPAKGQSEEQQDRDRYECHSWGVRETGFDPARHMPPGEERGSAIPSSAGRNIGAAAAVGAVIGAVAAGRGDSLEGAIVGAMAGTALGTAAASAEQEDARRAEQARAVRVSVSNERRAAQFRRAMSACLEGRGYTVK